MKEVSNNVAYSNQKQPDFDTNERAATYISSVINFSQQPELGVAKVKRQAETTTSPTTTSKVSSEEDDDTVEQPESNPTEKPKTKITIDFLGDNASPPFGRNPFQIAQNLPGNLFNIGLTAARKTAQNAVDFGSNQFTTISEAARNTAGGFGHLFSSGSTSMFCKMFLESPGCKFQLGD